MARTKADPKKHETPGNTEEFKKTKKPHRWKPGTVALRDIRKYQRSTELLIPKAPMRRLIRDVSKDTAINPVKWTRDAINAVHTAAEDELTRIFKNAYHLTMLRKASTISTQDLKAAKAVGLF